MWGFRFFGSDCHVSLDRPRIPRNDMGVSELFYMIKIYVKKQSSYPVGASKLKKRLRKFLEENGIVSDSVVSVYLVGKDKMLDIGKKYLGDNELHNVLSFTEAEVKDLPSGKGGFVYPPNEAIRLGEIVICYPKAIEEANEEGVLIEDRVCELLEHGAQHLLGIHHK